MAKIIISILLHTIVTVNSIVYGQSQQQPDETCNVLDTLIRNRNTMQAERCSKNTLCTEVNCTTVADVDQNEDPTHIVKYRVTFDPCAMPFTVRYQSSIEMVGNPPEIQVDNTTDSNITQAYGDDRRVDVVVTQTDNGVIFGVVIMTPEQSTPLQLFANTEIPLQCVTTTTASTDRATTVLMDRALPSATSSTRETDAKPTDTKSKATTLLTQCHFKVLVALLALLCCSSY